MDWDDIRVVPAVARAGQFADAARALKTDHATAARRVSALERALNARPLERRIASLVHSRSSTIRRRSATWPSRAGTRRPRSNAPTPRGQLEAVRAGIGIGVPHDFIARRHPDLVRVPPERRPQRSSWIVEHEDTRGLGRIRAIHDALVEATSRDRALFIAR